MGTLARNGLTNYNNILYPISVQYHVSIPPENVRKPLVF